MNVKILYLISTLRRCGPTNVMWNTIQTLDKNTFDIRLATMSPESDDSIIEEVKRAGVTVHQLNCGKLWPVTAIAKLRKVVEDYKPHIIHSHGVRPDIAAALGGQKAARVSTIHNVPVDIYRRKYGGVIGTVMSRLQFMALLAMDHPISCSNAVRYAWENTYGLSSDAICNGIDISGLKKGTETTKKRSREILAIPAGVPMIISTGGLSAWKRPDLIIKAFRKSRLGEFGLLYMCGTGDMDEICRQIAGGQDNIVFTGQVDNIPDYLAAADYYVSASELEGMPNSVLEAMALGLPAILSDIPPHVEILSYDIRAGKLFSCMDTQGLIQIFDSIDGIDGIDENAGEIAALLVERNFTMQIMGKQYAELYKKAVVKGEVHFEQKYSDCS